MILSKDIYYNAEVWTLLLHLLALVLLLLPFAPHLPNKSKRFKSIDLLCAATYLLVLLLSAAMILLPTNSFSITATTERIAGQVERIESRNYIWAPSYTLNHQEYTGAYLHINGEEYYCAVGEDLQAGDSIELLHAANCDYVMRYTIVDNVEGDPVAITSPTWVLIARYVLLGTGAYLLLRTVYLLFRLLQIKKEKQCSFRELLK